MGGVKPVTLGEEVEEVIRGIDCSVLSSHCCRHVVVPHSLICKTLQFVVSALAEYDSGTRIPGCSAAYDVTSAGCAHH